MSLLFSLFNLCVVVLAVGSVSYLLTLLVSAVFARPSRSPLSAAAAASSATPRVAVLIPAHNEELVLAATLKSLMQQSYPARVIELVVIADNCSDRTAEIARAHGATVMERTNLECRGKGYALEWAISGLLARPDVPDVFVIVDADTWVAPDFLMLMLTRIAANGGTQQLTALQGRYGVLNAGDGWRASLMAAAFDLFNHVRPLGQEGLGFSVGLRGNGMAFTRGVLECAPWRGHSITEDIDYGLDLLLHHGIRVGYVPEARVLAQMPVTAEQAASQRERWEGGRYRLVRERVGPLLRAWIRRRDPRCLDAALALLTPPLAELAALLALWGASLLIGHVTGWLPGLLVWGGALAFAVLGLAVYIIGGLRVAGAGLDAYLALMRAPFYAVWKLALYAAGLLRRPAKGSPTGPEWVRTTRIAIPCEGNGDAPGANLRG